MSLRRDGAAAAIATLGALLAGCSGRAAGDTATALAQLQQARELVAAARPAEARAPFERAVAADPDCLEARIEFGYFLLEDQPVTDYGGAVEQFEAAQRLDPEDPFALCGLGIASQELGDFDRAEPLLRAALASERVQQAPGRTMVATAALGKIAAIRGRTDEALARFAEAAQSPAANPRARAIYLSRRADLLAQSGREPEAEAELRDAIALDPENLRAHHLLSQLLAKRGAAADAQKEARIDEILRALSDHTARRFQEDGDRRVRLREELVAVWPEYARGRYELVRELIECGRHADARFEITGLVKRDGHTSELQELAVQANRRENGSR